MALLVADLRPFLPPECKDHQTTTHPDDAKLADTLYHFFAVPTFQKKQTLPRQNGRRYVNFTHAPQVSYPTWPSIHHNHVRGIGPDMDNSPTNTGHALEAHACLEWSVRWFSSGDG